MREVDPVARQRFDEGDEILNQKNPNENKNSPNGLIGLDRRWTARSGALGKRQIAWLNETIGKAKEKGQKVILVSHVPFHPETVSDLDNLAWDYDRVLGVIRGRGRGVVAAAFAGHDHRGTSRKDEDDGVLYLTMSAVLEAESEAEFAICDFYPDRILIRGFGDIPSFILPV